jgi:deoxyribodipyrimidine photolyase-related protein
MLTGEAEFAEWADGRPRLVMEDFYRWQRRRLGVLMDGDGPLGGRWNLDADNREPPPGHRPPRPYRPREGPLDDEVRRDLDRMRLATFGRDGPRRFAATAAEAGRALDAFVERALPEFGAYQDAMLGGERTMWHSLLSAPLNLGVLDPRRCVRRAEAALSSGDAPLNSVEGFVRQVIGWREFAWGASRQLAWAGVDALGADRPLPALLWGEGTTRMACLGDALAGLQETAYAHHIERLMLFGNLMLLLGVRPAEGLEWFRSAFVDAYDWVMAPNVLGMALHADGGRITSKPYAAGGRYVQRMSDHCGRCAYRPTDRVGERACPFTVLYWDFVARHAQRLRANPRTSRAVAGLERLDPGEVADLRDRAAALREDFDA